jgi:hypothetical protein
LAKSGGYVFPFVDKALRDVKNWGRIDQGVDFSGSGPILAIGDAKILSVNSMGWPNGGAGPAGRDVVYKLLNGPWAGRIIYLAEGVVPTVRAGQTVKAGQQVAKFYPGSSIETGLAGPSGQPLTPYNGAADGTAMPAGKKMHAFLQSLHPGGKVPGGGKFGTGATGTAGITHSGLPSPADILSAVENVPSAIVSSIFDTIGQEGARILLYVALVLGGGGLVAIGLGRAAGIKSETVAKAAKTGAAAAAL